MAADNKKENKLIENKKIFEDYFKDDLDAIEEELEKSKEYSGIIDNQITKLNESTLMAKGSQHYLIEHISNAVQLQSQRQSLRKDRFTIKKTIMDYASKISSGEDTDSKDMLMALESILEKERKKAKETLNEKIAELDGDVDSEIDNILNDVEKK